MPVYFCPHCNYDGDTHLASHCSQCQQLLPPVGSRRTKAPPAAAPSSDPFSVDPFTGLPLQSAPAASAQLAFAADPFAGPAPVAPVHAAFAADPFSSPPTPVHAAFAADPYSGLRLQSALACPPPSAGEPCSVASPRVDDERVEDEALDQGLGDPFAAFTDAPPSRPTRDEVATSKWRASELPTAPLEAPVSKVTADVDPARVKGWLRCDPFDAIPVVEAMLTIGRSLDSDMILPHPSVSKTHAMIRALGDDLLIEDRSTYGTSVNGKRVTTSAIKPGDTLTIGPYTIEVSAERFDGPRDDDTRPLPKLDSPEAMSGRLEKTALDEVLQQIEFYKKTGTLKVWTEGSAGMLVLYEGRPMFAEWSATPPLTDQRALFAMLALERGNFSFMAKVEAGEMTMSGTLTSLLMEYARTTDEA